MHGFRVLVWRAAASAVSWGRSSGRWRQRGLAVGHQGGSGPANVCHTHAHDKSDKLSPVLQTMTSLQQGPIGELRLLVWEQGRSWGSEHEGERQVSGLERQVGWRGRLLQTVCMTRSFARSEGNRTSQLLVLEGQSIGNTHPWCTAVVLYTMGGALPTDLPVNQTILDVLFCVCQTFTSAILKKLPECSKKSIKFRLHLCLLPNNFS